MTTSDEGLTINSMTFFHDKFYIYWRHRNIRLNLYNTVTKLHARVKNKSGSHEMVFGQIWNKYLSFAGTVQLLCSLYKDQNVDVNQRNTTFEDWKKLGNVGPCRQEKPQTWLYLLYALCCYKKLLEQHCKSVFTSVYKGAIRQEEY